MSTNTDVVRLQKAEARAAKRDQRKAAVALHKEASAFYGPTDFTMSTKKGAVTLRNGKLSAPGLKKAWASDCEVELAADGTTQRLGARRVVAGGVLLGPAGAIIGGMAKKGVSHNYLLVYPNTGKPVEVKLEQKEVVKARQLVNQVQKVQELESADPELAEKYRAAKFTLSQTQLYVALALLAVLLVWAAFS